MTSAIPVEAWIYFQALISQLLLNVVCKTAMINHVFKSFPTVQIYDLSYLATCNTEK